MMRITTTIKLRTQLWLILSSTFWYDYMCDYPIVLPKLAVYFIARILFIRILYKMHRWLPMRVAVVVMGLWQVWCETLLFIGHCLFSFCYLMSMGVVQSPDANAVLASPIQNLQSPQPLALPQSTHIQPDNNSSNTNKRSPRNQPIQSLPVDKKIKLDKVSANDTLGRPAHWGPAPARARKDLSHCKLSAYKLVPA